MGGEGRPTFPTGLLSQVDFFTEKDSCLPILEDVNCYVHTNSVRFSIVDFVIIYGNSHL